MKDRFKKFMDEHQDELISLGMFATVGLIGYATGVKRTKTNLTRGYQVVGGTARGHDGSDIADYIELVFKNGNVQTLQVLEP